MAKKAPAKKLPAKRKPRAKKPVPADGIERSEYSEGTLREMDAILNRKDIEAAIDASVPRWVANMITAIVLLVASGGIFAAGVWFAGGIDVSPSPGPADAVSAVYDTQEAAFRRLSGERAKALRAGEITSEKASSDWMAAKYLPESDTAWATLLTAEAAAFGGEKWTAEKEAATVGGYVR